MRPLGVAMLLFGSWCAAQRPSCEECALEDGPQQLSATMQIARSDEPGERLRITGTIRDQAGKPVEGVVLYCWHTNAEGIYPHRPSDPPNSHAYYHGYLRGWLRTGGDGRYVIDTIRPGSYPGGGNPAHIHCVAKRPGWARGRFVDEIRFAGDPDLEASQSRITLRGTSGGWEGEHNIVVPP